jgi:hypothetical protein
MSREYDGAIESSTDALPARWRLALLAFAVLLVGGVALVVALALGAADPPCMRVAAIDVETAGWSDSVRDGDSTYYTSDDVLPTPPFTIAVNGRSSAVATWGIWLDTQGKRFAALITRDGYLSTDSGVTWREFPHIRRDDNTLCVHVADGEMTLYVNNEVAWRDNLEVGNAGAWGYMEQN